MKTLNLILVIVLLSAFSTTGVHAESQITKGAGASATVQVSIIIRSVLSVKVTTSGKIPGIQAYCNLPYAVIIDEEIQADGRKLYTLSVL